MRGVGPHIPIFGPQSFPTFSLFVVVELLWINMLFFVQYLYIGDACHTDSSTVTPC